MKSGLIILLLFLFLSPPLYYTAAFESTSTNFEVHAGDVESITGSSSSANFRQQSGGGQNAIGIVENVKKVFSGILYWMFGWYTPRYEQIHYRWRNDDGSEAAATWAQVEDGLLANLSKNTAKRLRFEISNEGWTRGAGQQFKIEVAATSTCSSGSYAAVPTTATIEHWEMATSTYFADGDATTNILDGSPYENATFTPGEMKETGNQTNSVSLSSEKFTEIEYGIRATNNATVGGTYCFRLTNAGSATNFVYTKYAMVTVGGYPETGTLESSVFDTGVPTGAAYNSLIWKGTLGTGETGKVRLQLATDVEGDGPWTYYGSDCSAGTYYDTSANTPIEICSSIHNNKRYFRYKVTICSATNCVDTGSDTPQVDDVIVNWSP